MGILRLGIHSLFVGTVDMLRCAPLPLVVSCLHCLVATRVAVLKLLLLKLLTCAPLQVGRAECVDAADGEQSQCATNYCRPLGGGCSCEEAAT